MHIDVCAGMLSVCLVWHGLYRFWEQSGFSDPSLAVTALRDRAYRGFASPDFVRICDAAGRHLSPELSDFFKSLAKEVAVS